MLKIEISFMQTAAWTGRSSDRPTRGQTICGTQIPSHRPFDTDSDSDPDPDLADKGTDILLALQ